MQQFKDKKKANISLLFLISLIYSFLSCKCICQSRPAFVNQGSSNGACIIPDPTTLYNGRSMTPITILVKLALQHVDSWAGFEEPADVRVSCRRLFSIWVLSAAGLREMSGRIGQSTKEFPFRHLNCVNGNLSVSV